MESVTESNRLIAEFMGVGPRLNSDGYYSYVDGVFFTVRTRDQEMATDAVAKYVKYHSSWDWLIPVLEKIIRLEIGDDVNTIKYAFPRTFGMIDEGTGKFMVRLNGFFLHKENKLIDAAYSAIVEFINHYNTQIIMEREKLAGIIRIARFMETQVNLLDKLSRYDSDWNAIIPVIEKIEGMNNQGFDVCVGPNQTTIEMFRESGTDKISGPVVVASFTLDEGVQGKRIDHVFGAVLKFLDYLDSRATDMDISE